MDDTKKKKLEDFMAAVPEEELTSEKPSDTITLDEPKRRIWLPLMLYLLVFAVIAGVAYTGYRVYLSENQITDEEKIEGSIVGEEDSATEKPMLKIVYVDAEGGLNMRESASADAELVTLIPDKTKLEIVEETDGWIKVEYDDKTGWVSIEFTSAP
jgi:uncharacterized protein YgiM (DUF1202 family)